MPVKKRKNSPFYWYDFTIKGRRFRGSCQTDKIETAKALEAQLRSDILLGNNQKKELSIDECFSKYWLEHAHRLKSARSIEGNLNKMLSFFGASTPISELTNDDISSYKSWRLNQKIGKPPEDRKEPDKRKSVSPSTFNRDMEVLRKIVTLAEKIWKVNSPDINFTKLMMREPEPRTNWITEKQAKKLVKVAPDHLKPIILFALYTGLRQSNILKLEWNQVNLETREIEVFIKSNIPGGKRLVLPITTQVFQILQELKPKKEGRVFLYKSKPIDCIKRSFNTACKNAGIKNFRFHDLRHTSATWMLNKEIPIDIVQEVLGHTQITTTKKYAHRMMKDKLKALEAVSKAHIRHTNKPNNLQLIENKRKSNA